MSFSKNLEKQDIWDALKYIDENGVPDVHQSVKYELVTEDGRRYPPKYVIAVADHIVNGTDISTEGFNAVEAKSYLQSLGFTIETKQQEKYGGKDEKEREADEKEKAAQEELTQQFKNYRNPFSSMLIESKNIIFRGAPGTGKSYLAREIAADIISNGEVKDYGLLSDEQKKQVEFVQFHPSYDYTDFVEGLRPRINDDGSMGFELQDGVFKNLYLVPERIMRMRINLKRLSKMKCLCRNL